MHRLLENAMVMIIPPFAQQWYIKNIYFIDVLYWTRGIIQLDSKIPFSETPTSTPDGY